MCSNKASENRVEEQMQRFEIKETNCYAVVALAAVERDVEGDTLARL